MGGQLQGYKRGGHVSAPSPAAQIGAIRGPGTPTSDSINAYLSDGEHVIDSNTITTLGGGNNEAGQRAMEKIKQSIRKDAGMKNPKKPPTTAAVTRAKLRAGIGA